MTKELQPERERRLRQAAKRARLVSLIPLGACLTLGGLYLLLAWQNGYDLGIGLSVVISNAALVALVATGATFIFTAGSFDLSLGANMLVSALVGALAADLSLHMSDYRAAERTFQLLTQAAGRAGRGEKTGSVVIQTYEPDHYSIKAAAAQDYQAFYEEEILYRSLMDYPPVGGMLALHGQGEDESYLQMAMEYLKKYLDVLAKKTQARVIGPADESVSKVADIYRKVIYVRHGRKEVLDQIKERTEQYIEINRGFDKITIQYDRD